jgi:hypothetical protein
MIKVHPTGIGWHAPSVNPVRCHGQGARLDVGGCRLGRELDSVPAGVFSLVSAWSARAMAGPGR